MRDTLRYVTVTVVVSRLAWNTMLRLLLSMLPDCLPGYTIP